MLGCGSLEAPRAPILSSHFGIPEVGPGSLNLGDLPCVSHSSVGVGGSHERNNPENDPTAWVTSLPASLASQGLVSLTMDWHLGGGSNPEVSILSQKEVSWTILYYSVRSAPRQTDISIQRAQLQHYWFLACSGAVSQSSEVWRLQGCVDEGAQMAPTNMGRNLRVHGRRGAAWGLHNYPTMTHLAACLHLRRAILSLTRASTGRSLVQLRVNTPRRRKASKYGVVSVGFLYGHGQPGRNYCQRYVRGKAPLHRDGMATVNIGAQRSQWLTATTNEQIRRSSTSISTFRITRVSIPELRGCCLPLPHASKLGPRSYPVRSPLPHRPQLGAAVC